MHAPFEARLEKRIRRLVKRLERETLAALRAGRDSEVTVVRYADAGILFDAQAIGDELWELVKADVTDAEEAGFKALVKDALEHGLGEGLSFDPLNPRTQAHLRMKELLVKTIPQGWHEKLRDQLLMGNANGEPVAKIAQRVQGVYEGLGDYSARRVAQTEIVGGYNNGAFAGMVAAGVERKQWISTLDNRVRDSHALMFGEIARVDMPFSNGLQHPGGEGPASEVIGCRCCVVAYYGEEAKQPTVATEPVGEPTMPALPNPPN